MSTKRIRCVTLNPDGSGMAKWGWVTMPELTATDKPVTTDRQIGELKTYHSPKASVTLFRVDKGKITFFSGGGEGSQEQQYEFNGGEDFVCIYDPSKLNNARLYRSQVGSEEVENGIGAIITKITYDLPDPANWEMHFDFRDDA